MRKGVRLLLLQIPQILYLFIFLNSYLIPCPTGHFLSRLKGPANDLMVNYGQGIFAAL